MEKQKCNCIIDSVSMEFISEKVYLYRLAQDRYFRREVSFKELIHFRNEIAVQCLMSLCVGLPCDLQFNSRVVIVDGSLMCVR